jgi:hypothetical protein
MGSECSRRCFLIRSAGMAAGIAIGSIGLVGCNKQSESGGGVKEAGDMIAYCGLDCSTCRIYLATREKDPEKQKKMREGIARYIREHFDPNTSVKDITDCDGCTANTGRLYSGCQKCEVRKCARQKGVKNCAYCKEYACGKLNKLYDSGGVEPDAKKRLDAIKARL